MADPRNSAAPADNRGETLDNQPGGLPPIPGEVAEHLDGALVLLVRTAVGRYRRRVFLTVQSAQRAADRATEAGHIAEVTLCRLSPVAVIV